MTRDETAEMVRMLNALWAFTRHVPADWAGADVDAYHAVLGPLDHAKATAGFAGAVRTMTAPPSPQDILAVADEVERMGERLDAAWRQVVEAVRRQRTYVIETGDPHGESPAARAQFLAAYGAFVGQWRRNRMLGDMAEEDRLFGARLRSIGIAWPGRAS